MQSRERLKTDVNSHPSSLLGRFPTDLPETYMVNMGALVSIILMIFNIWDIFSPLFW